MKQLWNSRKWTKTKWDATTHVRVGRVRNINIAAASEERVKFPYNCVVFETVCSHTLCIASLHRFKSRLVLRKLSNVPGVEDDVSAYRAYNIFARYRIIWLLKYKEVIFVDFEVKKQLEAARRILEDLRESLWLCRQTGTDCRIRRSSSTAGLLG